jgi:hypothetical protein
VELYIYAGAILAALALIELYLAWNAFRWRLWRRVKPALLIALVLVVGSVTCVDMMFRRPPLEPARLYAISKDWACSTMGLKDHLFCAPSLRACVPVDKSSTAGPHDNRESANCG